jgi:hypothetical protein
VNAEVGGSQAQALRPQTSAYRRVLLRGDGSLGWGSRFTPRSVPSGDLRAVSLLGARGARLGVVNVVMRRFDSGKGGFLLIPEAALSAAGLTAIRAGSARLALPAP